MKGVRTIPFDVTAWTVAAFAVAAAPHVAAMPAWLGAILALPLLWRLAAASRRWRPMPGWLRLVLTLVAAALVLFAFGGQWGRRMAAAFLCMMLAVKMFEMFRVRDLRLVASVSFFLIATQFLFSERLFYLAYLLVGSITAVIALLRIQHFVQAAEGSQPRGHLHNPPTPDVARAVAALAAALPVALVLFALFPRLAQPLWGLPDRVMDGRTGLSDNMTPGSIATLFADDSPAFRVEFEGDPPPHAELYWRGPVLWLFDGDTWHQPIFTRNQPAAPVPETDRDRRYEILLEPHERRWLFALDHATASPPGARRTLDHQIISRRPITTLSRYSLRSNPGFIDMPDLNPNLRGVALRLPRDRNPRTRQRARELRAQFDDNRALIDAVLDWFRNEAFYYTLETTPTGRNGADEFLFDLREGFCEHYASAFAILMRAAGIPARVVTGYQGGFRPAGADYLLIRQSDAHAWVEVWLEDSGWTRVDPTAAVSPARIREGASSIPREPRFLLDQEWVQALRNQYDRIQHLWNRWVLGFDAGRQQRMLQRLGLPALSPAAIGGVMAAVLALIVAVIAAFLLRAPRTERDPLQRAWRRLLRRLGRAGVIKRPSDTPREFLDRARSELPQCGSALKRLAALYLRARYGPGDERAVRLFIAQARAFRPHRSRTEHADRRPSEQVTPGG